MSFCCLCLKCSYGRSVQTDRHRHIHTQNIFKRGNGLFHNSLLAGTKHIMDKHTLRKRALPPPEETWLISQRTKTHPIVDMLPHSDDQMWDPGNALKNRDGLNSYVSITVSSRLVNHYHRLYVHKTAFHFLHEELVTHELTWAERAATGSPEDTSCTSLYPLLVL